MDAISLLRTDHQSVQQLFKRFEKAGDTAYTEKRQIVDRIIEELSVHAAIEEQLFYPVARATVPGTEDIALESLEEHHIVKWLLSELVDLDPRNERFDAKVTVLIENVRHHVEEEQNEFFPKVRNGLSRKELADLGDAMQKAKAIAPSRPHPRAADTPPGNTIMGTIVGVMDRVGDNLSGIAQGGVTAAQDLIARFLHNKTPKVSPTGPSATRKMASNVRDASSNATDGVVKTARTAKSGATSTARSATAGVKGTLRTAKKSGRTTAASAKRGATTTGRTARTAARSTAGTAKRAAKKTAASARGSR
jgi:hemerythrin-like domain-containing protein